jgi:hypothetical protein
VYPSYAGIAFTDAVVGARSMETDDDEHGNGSGGAHLPRVCIEQAA